MGSDGLGQRLRSAGGGKHPELGLWQADLCVGRRQPDIALARQRLGWKPTMPLQEGLKATIEWFRTIDLGQYRPPTPNF